MSQQNLLELAKQGNPNAIAALMNRNLRSKGITAKVSRKDDCLRVILESSDVLNQGSLVEFVRNGVLNLKIAGINTLEIFARQIGNEVPVWSRTIKLSKPHSTTQKHKMGSRNPQPSTSNLERQRSFADKPSSSQSELNSSSDKASSDKASKKNNDLFSLLNSSSENSPIVQLVGAIFFSLFALIMWWTIGRGSDPSPIVQNPDNITIPNTTAPTTEAESKPEELLAVIDGQPQRVAEYTALLDQLVPKCQEDRMLLADMSVTTQELLTQKGASANNLQILNAVYQGVKPYSEPQECAAAFALIATVVNQ